MLNRPARLASAFLVSILLAAVTVAASNRWPQTPTNTGTDLVVVDFRAFAPDGKAVLDLKQDDVTLKVDGRQREIQSFAVLQLSPPPGPGAANMPPPYATNVGSDRRDIMIIVDDQSVAPGGESLFREPIAQFVGNLSPDDRVGFRTPGSGLGVWPTDRHDLMLSVLNTTIGRAPASEADTDAICRSKMDLDAMKAALDDISHQPHPMLVFVSRKLSAAPRDTGSGRSSKPAGECELRWQDIDEVGTTASSSHVRFYVMQIVDDSLTSTSTSSDQVGGLDSLAGVSGHPIVRLRRNGPQSMKALAMETAAYYLVSFEPDASEQNGNAHKVEISLKRQGVKVDAWPRVTIPKPATPAVPVKNVKDMLRLSSIERNVALRASSVTSRAADPAKVQVVVLFEPMDPSVKLISAVAALYDATGQLVVQATMQAAALTSRPIGYLLAVRPGRYLLRVGAIDAAGQAGTVDDAVQAELASADPIKMSTIVLGAMKGGSFQPRLEFSNEAQAVAQFEIYGVPKGQKVTAVFEMTETPDGPAIVSFNGTVSEDKDVMRVYGPIPLPKMEGQIIVRAMVSVDGKPVGRLFRTLTKTAS